MVPALDKKIILRSIVLLVVGLLVGYLIGHQTVRSNPLNASKPIEKVVYKTNPLFASQTAGIAGKITSSDGKKITVLDSKDHSDSFSLSSHLMILAPSSSDKVSSPSANVKDIKLNQSAQIYLQLVDGDYQVVSIVYSFTGPPPSVKKAPIR